MDEAERCHRLACMAAGKILAVGTVSEVVSSCGLHSCRLTGPSVELSRFADQLRDNYDDLLIAPFGAAIHVSSTSVERLEGALSETCSFAGLSKEYCEAGLEDVFIYLMAKAGRR